MPQYFVCTYIARLVGHKLVKQADSFYQEASLRQC